MSLASAARDYAARGLPIFPLSDRTKFPVKGSHGWKDASPDAAPWSRSPRRNIGIAVAPARLVLIDDDRRDGSPLPWDLPATWTVRATRGPHRYYRVPDDREWAMAKVDSIDVIANGYGLLPPSVHPSGHVYAWDDELNPCTMHVPAMLPSSCVGIVSRRHDVEYEPDGSAAESFLGAAFAALGWLGVDLGNGKRAVRCPWEREHSADTGPSSTVIFAPRVGGMRIGSFSCRHGHCKGRRTDDVIEALPRAALVSAARAGYRRELAMLGSKSQ